MGEKERIEERMGVNGDRMLHTPKTGQKEINLLSRLWSI